MSRLGDRLARHLRKAPDAPVVHDGERWWTVAELVAAADRLALGVGPGDVVAIAIDRGIAAVLAICATARAGAVPALIDPHDRELCARTLARLRPAVVLADPAGDGLPGARVVEPGRPAVAAGALPWQAVRRAEAIAHIIFTSGTTAGGKGVVWSELRARFDWMINKPRRRMRRRIAGVVVPLCTALGYHDLVNALYHRTRVALLDPPFAAAIAQARALGVGRIKLTPTHVELLLATSEELPRLRAVLVASAPIAPDRLRALAARLPGARIGRTYGLTESGAAAMVWLHDKPGRMHTVGRAIGFRRLTVRDPDGRLLPPGQAGEVVIELPMWDACDGYLDAPPELARRFDNGTLWTGDRGSFDEFGFLVLGHRNAEILKVGGRSVGAPRIEEALAGAPGIAEVAVVGVPDRVLGEVPCAVYVPAGRAPVSLAGVTLRPDELPCWLLPRHALPRGPSGKLRRGVIAGEAARWTRWFPHVAVPDHVPYPAFDLEGGVAIVDGWPPDWRTGGAVLDGGARVIALVARAPARPLALAVVQAGAAAAADARFIVGPVAVPLPGGRVTDELVDVFAGELVALAELLPGPVPRALYALPAGSARGFAGAGFAPLAGHPGWLGRGLELAEPLDGVAAALPALEAWARAAAERMASGDDS